MERRVRTVNLGVVIPTYQRPDWLARAYSSLLDQSSPPASIAVVARFDDEPTLARARALIDGSPIETTLCTVHEPGHMPPVQEGSRALSRCDLIAWLDDDAEAPREWVATFAKHFDDARVGAVGGRVVNHDPHEVPIDEREADVFGKVDRCGRPIGNLYRPGAPGVIDADFFMGGNVCFRRAALEEVRFDMVLNRDVAFHYEVDVALQIKNAGWTIRFDPDNPIRHYSAPRAGAGMRGGPSHGLRAAARNITRIRARRLSGSARAIALAYAATVGGRRDPGWLAWPALVALERSLDPARRFVYSTWGRLQAYRELRK